MRLEMRNLGTILHFMSTDNWNLSYNLQDAAQDFNVNLAFVIWCYTGIKLMKFGLLLLV